MELSDLRLALRRYWPVVILAMVLWVLVGVIIGVRPANRYRASATIVARPTDAAGTNPGNIVNFEIPTVVAEIASRSFWSEVHADLPKAIADKPVGLSASVEEGTGIIHVTADGKDPKAVAAWATAGARRAVSTNEGVALTLKLLDTAVVPGTPYSPKPVATMVGAVMAGLLTGVLATVVVHRTRRALDLEEEVRRRLGLPVIGQIPVVRRLRRGTAVTDKMLAGDARFVEAIQGLRTNVELASLDPSGTRVVAVASWGSGEGKSTVAAALGVAVAAGGREVVVIDADLRKPSQHEKLGEPFGEGLADSARVDIAQLVRRTGQSRLLLLPAGVPDRHPSDIIGTNLPLVLQRLRGRERLVIVDVPPIHGIPETPLALTLAGRIILVVDASSTKLPEIERAVSELQASGLTVLGVVLNRVHGRKPGNYGYGSYSGVVPLQPPPVPAAPNEPVKKVADHAVTEPVKKVADHAAKADAPAPVSRISATGPSRDPRHRPHGGAIEP